MNRGMVHNFVFVHLFWWKTPCQQPKQNDCIRCPPIWTQKGWVSMFDAHYLCKKKYRTLVAWTISWESILKPLPRLMLKRSAHTRKYAMKIQCRLRQTSTLLQSRNREEVFKAASRQLKFLILQAVLRPVYETGHEIAREGESRCEPSRDMLTALSAEQSNQ